MIKEKQIIFYEEQRNILSSANIGSRNFSAEESKQTLSISKINEDRNLFRHNVKNICANCGTKVGLHGHCFTEDQARNGSPETAEQCFNLKKRLGELGTFNA